MSNELEHDGDEDFDPASDSELPEDLACKSCGRVVLLGPPCCYNKLYGLYFEAIREISWHRKIQGKQAKRILALQSTNSKDRLVASIVTAILIGSFIASLIVS